MLHTKFRGNRFTGSGEENEKKCFTIYEHSSHLGHVTSILFTNFQFVVPKSLHTKFC